MNTKNRENLKKIYYFNGTHWDREWYKPFQGFRYMLIDTIEEVIETLEGNPDFSVYMLDGQTAVLDDFTEIVPEMRSRLQQLIHDGRIAVGPWYTMPDEFLPSGESLIRNLLLGHQKATEYGAKHAMKYGYICDIFGHIAQMPQIFRGFGIEGALIQRGCNDETCPPHFIWRAPDGSECYTYKTPEDFGYGAFYHYVTEAYNNGLNKNKEELFSRAIREIDKEAERLNQPYLVLDDALDHQHITKPAPWLAEKLSIHYGCPVVFQTLDHLVNDLRSVHDELPVKEGELAETSKINKGTNILLTYTLSSRYDIKKQNDRVQTLWEKWAEPLTVMHLFDSKKIRNLYREIAYKYIIQNHAHDSICGCSVEEVHRDMHYRFQQASLIAEEVIDDCLRRDASKCETNSSCENMIIRIFNPLPYSRRETIKTKISFNKDFSAKFSEGEREYEWKPSFLILDKNGREVEYTLCGVHHNRINKTPTQYIVDYAEVCFTADLVSSGYCEYSIIPAPALCRKRYINEMSTSHFSTENKYIRVTIQNDGTISLTDLRNGKEYRDLISYCDDGEIGDGWMHVRPSADRIIYSGSSQCIIEKIYDGPAETSYRIKTNLMLPAGMEYNGGGITRSEKYVSVPILTTLRLGKDNPFVDVETEIENNVMDHRLRICLPTDVEGETYTAGQAFTMLKRQIGPDVQTGDWKEPQMGDRNFNGILAKRDTSGNGLAFLSAYGLHEAAALNDTRNSLIVTLFRGFAKTVGTNDYDQCDGQLLGKLNFKYRLLPLTSNATNADLVRCSDELQTGIRQYTIFAKENYIPADSAPIVELQSSELVISAIKTPQNNEAETMIIRVVNYSENIATGSLCFRYKLEKVNFTDLLEVPVSSVDFNDNSIFLSVEPCKIVTLRIKFIQE